MRTADDCADRVGVHRVGQVEAGHAGGAVLGAEEPRAHQQPEHREGVVDAHEHRHLELVAHAELVQQHGHEDGAAVDVEHLADAVLGEVAQVLVGPLDGVVVGLADAAEVAGDGVGAAQVHVGAVDALGVQGLDVAGADDLHGRGHGEHVLARRRLLGHVAHADVAARA